MSWFGEEFFHFSAFPAPSILTKPSGFFPYGVVSRCSFIKQGEMLRNAGVQDCRGGIHTDSEPLEKRVVIFLAALPIWMGYNYCIPDKRSSLFLYINLRPFTACPALESPFLPSVALSSHPR